jgi:transcriptional regulator with XRE-family HTH domain
MASRDPGHGSERFHVLREQIDADPQRRARVEEYKAQMLSELRRELDLTQAALADRLNVTQENVSQIESGVSDMRVSTLRRYVEALGGRVEMRATFADRSVNLTVDRISKTGKREASRVAAKAVTPDGRAKPKRATAS